LYRIGNLRPDCFVMDLVVELDILDVLLDFGAVNLMLGPLVLVNVLFGDTSFVYQPVGQLHNIHLLDLHFLHFKLLSNKKRIRSLLYKLI
jgi:hypothetical protein